MLQSYEMFYKEENGKRIPNIYKFQALVTTYECIISDCELLSDIEWRCLIIDEAHRLKNAKCRLMEGLKMFDCVSGRKILFTCKNLIFIKFEILNSLNTCQLSNGGYTYKLLLFLKIDILDFVAAGGISVLQAHLVVLLVLKKTRYRAH